LDVATQGTTVEPWFHTTTAGLPRIEPLTGLRWLAALAVFFSHNVPGGDTPPWIASLFTSGYMGVTIFFVLSGFILAVTYAESLSRPSGSKLWNFAVARIARIMPLYLLVLAFVMLRKTSPIPENWWMHLLALQPWSDNFGFAYALNGPGWSVGVELFLYAMFPLLILLYGPLLGSVRGGVLLALSAVTVLLLMVAYFQAVGGADLPWIDPASAHRWIYRTPLTRLGDFTLGMSAAAIFVHLRRRGGTHRWAPVAAILSIAVMVGFMATPALLMTPISYDVLYAVPGTILILALALAPHVGVARLLGSVILVALGELSFAFYLIHIPIGGLLTEGVLAEGITWTSAGSLIMSLFFLVALSWGLHVIFERPARIWLRGRFLSGRAVRL
jgi:peptidoglycan/LPS O-acetylase OafA/YrhL